MLFSTWSLFKLADFLVAKGVVDDISHEGLRLLLREEGVSFQVIKTWKRSTDPDCEAENNRVLQLHAIADGQVSAADGDPTVVFCLDEFGPLNLQPHPAKQWAARGGGAGSPRRRPRDLQTPARGAPPARRLEDLTRDRLYGPVKTRKGRLEFLAFCRYLRSLYPAQVRLALVLDNFNPHLSARRDQQVAHRAAANNVVWPTSRSTPRG